MCEGCNGDNCKDDGSCGNDGTDRCQHKPQAVNEMCPLCGQTHALYDPSVAEYICITCSYVWS